MVVVRVTKINLTARSTDLMMLGKKWQVKLNADKCKVIKKGEKIPNYIHTVLGCAWQCWILVGLDLKGLFQPKWIYGSTKTTNDSTGHRQQDFM